VIERILYELLLPMQQIMRGRRIQV